MKTLGGILSVLGLGLLAGGMLFFPIMTLLLFTRLPLPVAGPFVSSCFPVYYAYMLVFSALSGFGFVLRRRFKAAAILWGISLITLWAWFWMIPQMNADLHAGQMSAFNTYHRVSTWIDGIEFVLLLVLLMGEGERSAKSQRFY